MRWPVFIIIAFATVALQMSVGAAIAIELGKTIRLGVDFLAILAVFTAFVAPRRTEAIWASWILGLLIDLSATATPIGMNALCYAGASAIVYNARAMVFTDSIPTQFVYTGIFCIIAHGMARLFMNLYVRESMVMLWSDLLNVLVISLTTAIASPILLKLLLGFARNLLVTNSRGRRRR